MLIKGQKDELTVSVTIEAKGDHGKTIRDKMHLTVKRLGRKKIAEYNERFRAEDKTLTEDDVCEELITGWQFKDVNGEEVEFNPDNLAEILDHPDYFKAIRHEVFLTCLDMNLKELEQVILKAALAKN